MPTQVTPQLRLSRDAAHGVVRDRAQYLREDLFSEITPQARTVDAKPLPNVMVFPKEITLETSRKHIEGVRPPSAEVAQRIESVLFTDDRAWWTDQTFDLEDGSVFSVGRYDGAVKLNHLERIFARALELRVLRKVCGIAHLSTHCKPPPRRSP